MGKPVEPSGASMTSRNVSRIVENLGKLVLASSFTCALLAPMTAIAQKPYRVLSKWTIGGQGGWDYLAADAGAHRLYVTHGTQVEVLDTTSGKVMGSIQGLQGIHGVAF